MDARWIRHCLFDDQGFSAGNGAPAAATERFVDHRIDDPSRSNRAHGRPDWTNLRRNGRPNATGGLGARRAAVIGPTSSPERCPAFARWAMAGGAEFGDPVGCPGGPNGHAFDGRVCGLVTGVARGGCRRLLERGCDPVPAVTGQCRHAGELLNLDSAAPHPARVGRK